MGNKVEIIYLFTLGKLTAIMGLRTVRNDIPRVQIIIKTRYLT